MSRAFHFVHLALLPVLLLSACGGGGGGGGGGGPVTPPPPPPTSSQAAITTANATLVAALGNGFLEAPLQLTISALDNVFDLSDSRQLSFDMDCDSFSTGGSMVLIDNDANGVVSSGDVVQLDYNNCRQVSLGDFATGRINVDIVSFAIASDLSVSGEINVNIPASLTFDSGNSNFVDVSGTFSVLFTATPNVDNLDISMAAGQSLQIVVRGGGITSTEVADQLSISRRIFDNAFSINGSFAVDSDSAGGEFDCSVTTELSGTLSQFPDAGTFRCLGLNNSAVRVVATAGNSIVTEVDPEGDGSFIDAGVIQDGNGLWGDYVEGQLFAMLVDRPDVDPTQLIPNVSSIVATIAAGDAAFDAAYNAVNNILYLSNSSGIEVFDPVSMMVLETLAIADRPGPMDVSDDGSTLWIGLRDTPEIVPVDIATLVEGSRVPLGVESDFGLPRFASDIQVAPGSVDTVVVATTDTREVLAYRAGVQLANFVDDISAATVVEFDDANTIIGIHGNTTLAAASQMTFDANGVTLVKALPEYSVGSVKQMSLRNGIAWVGAGRAIDVANESILGRVYFDQEDRAGFSDGVYADADTGTTWFFDTLDRTLESFDSQTFRALGAFRLTAALGREAWIFEVDGDDFLIAMDNEVHRVDRSVLSPTLAGRACSTIDLGGQLGAAVFLQIDCVFNDAVYDSDRNLIYASLPSAAGRDGNSIAIIDPLTGSIRSYIYVGSEPDRLAISADGSLLYVALNESNRVARVDLQSQQLGSYIRLLDERGFSRPSFAQVIAASTQSAVDVVVSAEGETALYSDGVQGLDLLDRFTDMESLFYNAAGTGVYGVEAGRILWTFDVGATGLTNITETRDVLVSRGAKIENDELHDYLGKIVEPATATLIGTCSVSGATAVEPDPANDDIYYLATGFDSEMQVCDRTTQAVTKTFAVPKFGGGFFFPRLTKAGATRIAITNDDKMVLLDPTEF